MKIITDDITEIEHEPFHAPMQRWLSLKPPAGGLPALDAYLALPDELADFRIVAALRHDPIKIHYQSVGAALEKLYGQAMTGKNLEELYNDWFRKRAYEGYSKCVEAMAPVYERHGFASLLKKLGYHKLMLPFGEAPVTRVISYIMPLDKGIKQHDDWDEAVRATPWLKKD